MDAIIERCCGIYVHKKTIVACLLVGKPGEKQKPTIKTFSTMTELIWTPFFFVFLGMKKYTNMKIIMQVLLCLTPFRLCLHSVKQITKTLSYFLPKSCPNCSEGIHPCLDKETTIKTKGDKIDCEAMRENGICPVLNHKHPVGMLGTYCWFRGKVITLELEALGYSDLAVEFYYKKSSEEIESLLEDVKEVYEKIKESHKDNGKSLKGAGWNGHFKDGEIEWETYSTYEDIKSELENTIKWLEILIENNCGFRAWY